METRNDIYTNATLRDLQLIPFLILSVFNDLVSGLGWDPLAPLPGTTFWESVPGK